MSIFWASTADGFSGTLPCRDGHLHLVRIPSDKRELCERIDRLCQNSLSALPGTADQFREFFLEHGFQDAVLGNHPAVQLAPVTEEVQSDPVESPDEPDEDPVTPTISSESSDPESQPESTTETINETMPQLELTIGASSPVEAQKVFNFAINEEEAVFIESLIPVIDPNGNGEIDEEFKETIPIDEKVLWFTIKDNVEVDVEIKLRVLPDATTPSA